MNCETAGRRVAHATLIPLLLIVVGIFVWGVRYKLSLYDSPVSPSRSVAEAKLLSPNERPGSVQTASQIRPQTNPSSPLYSGILPIAVLCSGIVPVRISRANASTSQGSQSTDGRATSFFFFRPPPAFLIA